MFKLEQHGTLADYLQVKCISGHVICIFGIKDESGVKKFRIKDSNHDDEQHIPVSRPSYQEVYRQISHKNSASNSIKDIPYIGAGYAIQLKKK